MATEGYYYAPHQPGRIVRGFGVGTTIYEDDSGHIHEVKDDSFARWVRKFGAKVCSCDPMYRGEAIHAHRCGEAKGVRHACTCRCHRYENGLLLITVHDNDYAEPIRRAALDILENIREGNPGQFTNAVRDMEGFGDSIVIGTYGHVIARKARPYRQMHGRLGMLGEATIKKYFKDQRVEETLDYLEKRMEVILLPSNTELPEWSNGEEVYIDFNTNTVHIR